MSSSAVGWAVCLLAISSGLTLADEVVFQEDFTHRPAAEPVFTKTYGDEPKSVDQNAVTADEGEDGKPGAALRLTFAGKGEHSLSYWVYTLAEPLPLVDGLTRIEVRLRTNVRVALKVGMSPYGFIYHAGGVPAADGWQTLAMDRVAGELHDWVRRGQRDPRLGYVSSIILAIQDTSDTSADIRVARVTILAADGTRAALADEVLRRRAACVRLAAMSMLWSDEERTLSKVLEWLGIAKHMGADLAVLPQECVAGPGEPIPGPTSQAIAARAKQLGIWVVGNLRETADGRTYVTSFLVNRAGEVVGTYRKSHKLPDEDMDLGDALPVFRTELGTIAMKIGTDRHFAEIDHCYAVQGAQILCWSQRPEPLEDEQLQDRPVPGMATDYGMTYVCSRYASAKPGWITNMYPTYPGRPIGRAFVVDANGSRVASTRHTGGGVALATIPVGRLGFGRPRPSVSGFKLLGQPNTVPPRPAYAKRVIRVGMIDSGVPIRTLLERLDACGREGCDIVCTYEMVWIAGGPAAQVAAMTAAAKKNLEQVAAKAAQWRMYVMIAGVVDRLERNEAILYDRAGKEVWRYFKIVQTHPEQICGDQVPVYDTDFGRLGAWICADEAHVEIPRCLLVQGADLVFTPTQSWGPDATYRDDRDISRAMNAGLFLVEVTHPSTEPLHNSKIIDPCGAVVAQSGYNTAGYTTAVLDLDHQRPRRYAREWTAHTPGGYLPEYQEERIGKECNDLFDVTRAQRRPELYRGILWPEK